jgi:hypothetical protein
VLFGGIVAGLATGFWLWVLGLVATALLDWPDALSTAIAYLGAAVAAGVPIAFALADLTTKAEVEAQIVRLRAFKVGSNGDNPRYAYWVALDDGRSREVKALGVDEARWQPLAEGDLVRARVGRRLGWIHDIEVVRRSRHLGSASYDDTGEHVLEAPENLGEVPVFDRTRPVRRTRRPAPPDRGGWPPTA